MTVSFDFDSTLDKPSVQKYAKELLDRGIDVWVVTSRFDENHQHRFLANPQNNDLWEVIDRIGIPRYKVRFTNMENKVNYFIGTNIIWHLDDDWVELNLMNNEKSCYTIGISVIGSKWKEECEKYFKSN